MSDDTLWGQKRCAEYLGFSYDHFRKVIRYKEGVPQPVNLPGCHERWVAQQWRDWAENSGKTRNQPATEHVSA